MSVRIETDNGYEIEFLAGLDADKLESIGDPREFESERKVAPIAIRGRPGLIDVRVQFEHEDDSTDDVFNFDFSAVLRPAGMFTNFRSGVDELRGEATIPARLFPVRVRSVRIQNLSDDLFEDRMQPARKVPDDTRSAAPKVARAEAAERPEPKRDDTAGN